MLLLTAIKLKQLHQVRTKMKKLLLLLITMMLVFPVAAQNRTDEHGLRQGKWTGTYSNGAVRYKGQFRNGKPYGTFFYYYPTGALKAKMTYSDSGHVARVTSYHLNGKPMAAGKFVDRKKDSTWRYFSETDGKLVLEENYSHGVKNGPVIIYYAGSGKPSEITEYKNGLKNGRWIKYFPDGKISTAGFYVNDTLQGEYTVYDITGKRLIQGSYKNGLQNGPWLTYDSLGRLQKKVLFRNGLPAKPKKTKTSLHE
jgi:antitoxin component YwqK of YwqJK toxin-antitoxin module